MPRIAVYIRNIIDEICADIINGDDIQWKANDQEFQWTWTNTRTLKQWIFNIRLFKRLIDQDRGDPRMPGFADFITNIKSPLEIQREMQKLESLKAFW